MKIKEVASNEIHWSIRRWNEGKQANDEMRRRLGDTARYFASCNIGHGYFQWNTNTIGQWQPLNEADPAQQELVAQRVEEIRQEVNAKMTDEPELAEQMLEVPTIDYYYFRELPTGGVDVVITGWGYRNFKKDPPFRVKTPQKKAARPTTIAFAIEGQKQPCRPFTLRASWTSNPDQKVTGDDGLFTIQEPVGTQLEVVDVTTGKRFNIQVSDTNTDIVFDVTDKTQLFVKAIQDGLPVAGEPVSIDYGGRHYNLFLADDGTANISDISVIPGQQCVATMRGERRSIELGKDADNVISFEFQSTPPDIGHCSLAVEAFLDGQPLNGETVGIDYAGNHYDLPLVNGRATLADLLIVNPTDSCTASLRDAQQSAILAPDSENTIRFELQSPPVMARITVVDAKGQPMRGAQLHLQQLNVVNDSLLDQQGSTLFVKDSFSTAQPLTAQVITAQGRQTDPIEFTLEPQENDYLLQENAVKKRNIWVEILLFLLMLIILALLLIYVFRPGANFLTHLIQQSIF